jgi:hypothetical protein
MLSEDITDEQHIVLQQQNGYRRLAAAVIYQALMDRGRGPSDRRYEGGRRFLEDTDMLPWIEIVGIDREALMDNLPEVEDGL